jgi:TPP-dependent pyruvate/acetoin dehydrogenase alpha subunit
VRCDGNDPLAVYGTVREAVAQAERGDGPTLVEMVTYRIGGHSTSDDPKAYRSREEVEEWAERDPLSRLRQHLAVLGVWDDRRDSQLRTKIEADLSEAIATAEAKDPPSIESLFEDVYEQMPWHLREQCDEALRLPRAKKEH